MECLSNEDYLTNSDADSGEDLNFCYQMTMEAGETYRFRAYAFENSEYSVVMLRSTAAETLHISEEKILECAVGDNIFLQAEFLPYGSVNEEVHWRISDRNIIEVFEEGENYFDFFIIGEGVATVEAHTDSGLYAEITVVSGDIYVPGDVNGNGQINSVDSNILKRYVGGIDVEINTLNSDMNEDGVIDSRDSNLLKREVAGQ